MCKIGKITIKIAVASLMINKPKLEKVLLKRLETVFNDAVQRIETYVPRVPTKLYGNVAIVFFLKFCCYFCR